MTPISISRYELGKSHIRRENLIKLCSKLGIDYVEFINKYATPYKCKNIELPTKIKVILLVMVL